MSAEVIHSRPIIPHTTYTCSQCKKQSEFPTPSPQPTSPLRIRCFQCSSIASYSFSTNGSSSGEPSQPRRGRQIGTQERPLETAYYELLGVPIDATTEDVKKAYRRLAIKHHPDKNRDDPHAEERFKAIAVAYQTLSDPALRKKYNEFGSKQATPEGGFMDPEEVFGIIFGGERFVSIIGHISLARDMKTALQEADEQEEGSNSRAIKGPDGKEILSPEERAKREEKERRIAAEKAKEREDRVTKLIANLERKLSIFTESATGVNDEDVTRSWKTICVLEAEDLKGESFGVDLLHAVGFVYATKARHFMATTQTFMGVGGWLHNVQGKYHVFSETVSTVRAALDVKRAFDELAAAEAAGLNPEQKKKLEEQAAEKGLQALFKGAKLEIESVLRETCERLLSSPPGAPPISRDKLILRARALELLGEAYMSVKKDGPDDPLENEYVKVDTRNSKERESFPSGQPSSTGRRDSTPRSPREAGMRWN